MQTIHCMSVFNHCDVIGPQSLRGNVRYDHLRLIGKRIVNFMLVLIKLFSLGVTAKALRAIIRSKSAISLQRGRLTQNSR